MDVKHGYIFSSVTYLPRNYYINKDDDIHKLKNHKWKNGQSELLSRLFCSLTDRPMDKIFTEKKLLYQINLHKKWTSILIRG